MSKPNSAIEFGLPDRNTRLEMFESAISGTRNGVVITTPDGAILYVNPAFTEITGYARDHVIGKNMRILQSGRQSQSFYEAMWLSIRTHDSWSGTIWNRRKDGEIYQEWLSVSVVRNEHHDTIAYVGIFSDISSIRSREHQLERLAYVDPLTELPNRLLFHDRLCQAMAFARRGTNSMALLIVDLDCVGAVNESHGRLFGDRILQSVSHRIYSLLDECDGAGRLAGDVFGVILSYVTDAKYTMQVVENIHKAVGTPHGDSDSPVSMTASIGIACFPEDADHAAKLIESAKLAMRAAKADGGNRAQFFSALSPRVESRD